MNFWVIFLVTSNLIYHYYKNKSVEWKPLLILHNDLAKFPEYDMRRNNFSWKLAATSLPLSQSSTTTVRIYNSSVVSAQAWNSSTVRVSCTHWQSRYWGEHLRWSRGEWSHFADIRWIEATSGHQKNAGFQPFFPFFHYRHHLHLRQLR